MKMKKTTSIATGIKIGSKTNPHSICGSVVHLAHNKLRLTRTNALTTKPIVFCWDLIMALCSVNFCYSNSQLFLNFSSCDLSALCFRRDFDCAQCSVVVNQFTRCLVCSQWRSAHCRYLLCFLLWKRIFLLPKIK